jgi:hypothetical protein
MSKTLVFGLRAIPNGLPAVWGARLIWPGDLVYDRQDMIGDEPARSELASWLNAGPLATALERMRSGDRAGLSHHQNHVVVLYEDKRGVIKGSPQASYGYLYVAAWLKP